MRKDAEAPARATAPPSSHRFEHQLAELQAQMQTTPHATGRSVPRSSNAGARARPIHVTNRSNESLRVNLMFVLPHGPAMGALLNDVSDEVARPARAVTPTSWPGRHPRFVGRRASSASTTSRCSRPAGLLSSRMHAGPDSACGDGFRLFSPQDGTARVSDSRLRAGSPRAAVASGRHAAHGVNRPCQAVPPWRAPFCSSSLISACSVRMLWRPGQRGIRLDHSWRAAAEVEFTCADARGKAPGFESVSGCQPLRSGGVRRSGSQPERAVRCAAVQHGEWR